MAKIGVYEIYQEMFQVVAGRYHMKYDIKYFGEFIRDPNRDTSSTEPPIGPGKKVWSKVKPIVAKRLLRLCSEVSENEIDFDSTPEFNVQTLNSYFAGRSYFYKSYQDLYRVSSFDFDGWNSINSALMKIEDFIKIPHYESGKCLKFYDSLKYEK